MKASIVQGCVTAALAVALLCALPSAGARAEGAAPGPQLAQTQNASAAGDPFAADEALVKQLLDSTVGTQPPRSMVEGLYDDPDHAKQPMAEYLSAGDPKPEERAKRAVTLARGIINSRRAITETETRDKLIDTLLEVASEVVCSAYFVGTEIGEGYVPRPSSFPYDFGGPASQLASGYTLITPASSMFSGGRPQAVEGLGTGALLFDAITGIDKIATFVPNGRYILILLTAVGGNYETFRMTVNGVDHWIVWTPASAWPMGQPLLVSAGMQLARTPVGGYAGKLSLPIRVANGIASIDFDALPPAFPIAAMELVLYDADLSTDPDEEDCLRWDRAQRAAILALLTEGGGQGHEPPDPPTGGCLPGDCPVEEPPEGSPSGAT
jgi:hypothetical protein